MSTGYPTVADDPREIDDLTAVDVAFLEGLDEQIVALGNELVEQRTRSFLAAYPKADPDGGTLTQGTVVALRASAGPEGEVLMQAATSANVAAGAVPFGLLTATTPAGSRGRVACGGMVPASVSGLAAGANLYVRANQTTGAAERVALLSPTDVALGLASPDGAVVIQPVERASFQPFVMMRVTMAGAVTLVSVRGLDAGDVTLSYSGTGEFQIQLPTGLPDIVYPKASVIGNLGGIVVEFDILDSRTVDVYVYNTAGLATDAALAIELA